MKSNGFVLLLSFVLYLLCAPGLVKSQPIMTLEPNALEFELRPGEVLEYGVTASNDGEDAMLRFEIEVMAYFIEVDPQAPDVFAIEPGEEMDINFIFSAENAPQGNNSGLIVFRSNDPFDSVQVVVATIFIQGGEQPLNLISRRIIPEEVFAGFPYFNAYELRNNSDQSVEVTLIDQVHNILISPEEIFPLEIEANSTTEIPYFFLPPLGAMIPRNYVALTYHQNDLSGSLVASYRAIEPIVPAFHGLRPNPNIGDMDPFVNNNEDADFRFVIEINEEAQGWLSVEPQEGSVASGEELEFDIEINPAGLDVGQYYLGELSFATNDPWMSTFTVPVGYEVEDDFSYMLVIENGNLDFGAVAVNDTVFSPLILRNQTGEVVTINEISIEGESFLLDGRELPFEIQARDFELLRVDYMPAEAVQSYDIMTVSAETDGQSFERGCIISGWGAVGLTTDSELVDVEISAGNVENYELVLHNSWDFPLVWEVEIDGSFDWLHISPESGELAGGGDQTLTVTISADNQEEGVYEASFGILNQSDLEPEVDLILHVPSGVADDNGIVVEEFSIKNIYPNPFNSSATITYALPARSDIRLEVFDVSGRLIDVLVDREMSAGNHSVVWDGEGVGAGVYLVRMIDGGNIVGDCRKVLLVK